VRPSRPGPAIVKCWHIEKNPTSHGMRVDRSSIVEMRVKHLYSTIGRGHGRAPADGSDVDLGPMTLLVTWSDDRPERDRGGK
jgi:hypothetical protein